MQQESLDTYNGQILTIKNNNQSEENEKIYNLCSEHLKQGGLVAFPTETVYGLGANALNETAVYSIFKAKKRPLTDPVIVHVLNVDEALKYIIIENNLLNFYKHLANDFWPGPLTIVSQSNPKIIPDCVTANTGFVGIRVPSHKIVRNLLEHCKLPISAPSANRFGHVSPTSAEHVFDDLGCFKKEEIDNENVFRIYILKEEEEEHLTTTSTNGLKEEESSTCSVGIESTVIKLEQVNDLQLKIIVLRRGGISIEQLKKSIERFINLNNNEKYEILIETRQHVVKMNENTSQVSPGQLITHYAPDVPAYILNNLNNTSTIDENISFQLKDVVIVDFHENLKNLKDKCLYYIDLSKEGDIKIARNKIFSILRECEKIENAKAILLPNLLHVEKEHADSLFDRLFRAASGTFCNLLNSGDQWKLVVEENKVN
ncbi:hypothetical protein ABK040_005978 [Willaertia magna]